MALRLFRAMLVSTILLMVTVSAHAQGWALPARTPNTDVKCATCPSSAKDKLTVGYSAPIKTFVGRFLDSSNTKDYQQTFRTARATWVGASAERNKFYMLIGSAVFSYDMDRFFSRLSAGETLRSASSFPVNASNFRSGPAEMYLQYDSYFYAENGSSWITPIVDGQDRLFGIDWDDRNLVYLNYDAFGWGIVKEPSSNGAMMETVVQHMTEGTEVGPTGLIMVIKSSSGQYTLISSQAGNQDRSSVFDVTNPASPVRKTDWRSGINAFAKAANGTRIAVATAKGALEIYTADALSTNGAPMYRITAPGGGIFVGVDSDGTDFYATTNTNGVADIWTIKQSGSTYTSVTTSTGTSWGQGPTIKVGGGYAALSGAETSPTRGWNSRVFKLSGGVPAEVSLGNYVSKYYVSPPSAAYTTPAAVNGAYINIFDSMVWKRGTKTYYIIMAKGLGDVYELQAGDSLSVALRRAGDTANPNAPTGGGPFYGDRFTFSLASSSNTAIPVNWDFGNPEAIDNTQAGTAGTDAAHQYSNIATLPATRTVTAVSASDGQVNGTASVTMAKPSARVAVKNTTLTYSAATAVATPFVTSDEFIDASDGALEGHFSTFTIDTAQTKIAPNGSVPVGPCGAHSMSFDANYGPYTGSGATLASSSTPYTVSINPITYTAKPFIAGISYTSDASNVTFSSATRFSTSATDLPGGGSTAVTYTWEIVSSANAVVLAGPTGSAALSAIPAFVAPKSTFTTAGLKARLTLVAASAAVGAGCQSYLTDQAVTGALNGPDPVVTVTGCGSVGAGCSLAVSSQNGLDRGNWSYTWTVPGSSVAGGTGDTFSPQFTTSGSYTVHLVVTNPIGTATVDKVLSVAAPVCGSDPANGGLAISYSGQASGCFSNSGISCKAGETVTFTAAGFSYTGASCDTYLWSFGDGTTSTAKRPTKAFSGTSTYTVTLKLTGGLSAANISTTVPVGSGTVTPPPPPPPCQPMSANAMSIEWKNGTSTCTTTGGCTTNDTVQFSLSAWNYSFACANHTFAWSFGNGKTSNVQTPSTTFSTPGTYTVNVDISNGTESVHLTRDITIAQGSGGNNGGGSCPTMTPSTVFAQYTNTTASCGIGSVNCKSGEVLKFSVVPFGYAFSCASHSFNWRFSDGGTGTGQQATHTFPTAGSQWAEVDVVNQWQTMTVRLNITLDSPVPVGPVPTVDFTYAPFNGTSLAYLFTPTATPSGVVTKWDWNFGDGTTTTSVGTTATPQVHVFPAAGKYTVSLATSDATRTFTVKSYEITVGGTGRGRAVSH